VEVRDAGVDDVRKIQRVARITWDHTYRETIPESVRREVVNRAYSADSLRHRVEANVFMVASHNGSVVGFAGFRSRSSTEAELAAIYVLPEMQGRGSGDASSRLVSAGSRYLRGSCFGSSRITCVPGVSTRPTVLDTPEITQ
jgi:N-acetylglutamate synthase-like GNAT family acetyltransferase